ncbi:MAG TPA: hypothetical protein VKZ46_03350 [Pedomonas sp.]|nr:hypothetical protein [Pedomonas sp.]
MIQSFMVHLPPDEAGRVFLIFDTVSDHKHAFTACGVGRVDRGEPRITETAQLTLNALAAYAEHAGLGRLHMVEIATTPAAPVRVRKALEAANDKEMVFFICRSPDVYDAAVLQLNVAWATDTGTQ